ncbi:hypothetical protein [Actinophytocola sp.]|uniref:hypothetical protein n=1 Tax=Actinophytocola sp. TaxID=1872138 RepID=UPI002EDB41D5
MYPVDQLGYQYRGANARGNGDDRAVPAIFEVVVGGLDVAIVETVFQQVVQDATDVVPDRVGTGSITEGRDIDDQKSALA